MDLANALFETDRRLRRVIRPDEDFAEVFTKLHPKVIVEGRNGFELIEEDSFAAALEEALGRNLTPEDPHFML